MKQTKNLIIATMLLLLSSCRAINSCNRSVQLTDRHYHIEQYSGGKLIQNYDFFGIVNNQTNSDGYYWYNGDTLIEVSGDVYLKSWK